MLVRGRKEERRDGQATRGSETPGITCSEESISPSFLFRFRGKLPVNVPRAEMPIREKEKKKKEKERGKEEREKDRCSRFCVVSAIVTARRGPFRRANFYYLEMFHVISCVEKQERVFAWQRQTCDFRFYGKLLHDVNVKKKLKKSDGIDNRYNAISVTNN